MARRVTLHQALRTRNTLGIQYATMAISQLNKIDAKDADRDEALDMVWDWLKKNDRRYVENESNGIV